MTIPETTKRQEDKETNTSAKVLFRLLPGNFRSTETAPHSHVTVLNEEEWARLEAVKAAAPLPVKTAPFALMVLELF